MLEKNKKIVVGADQNGLELKQNIKTYLEQRGYQVSDVGVYTSDPVDYPDIGGKLSEAISKGEYNRGILVCGTGAGMAIVANKYPGVRAVCVHDPYTAERSIASNNAQVITMGSQIIGTELAKKCIDVWLESDFKGGRSAPKVEKINQIDQRFRH